jgi:ribosome-associated protein
VTSKKLTEKITLAAQDVKAEDIAVLDLRKLVDFTDFFIVASGRSDRQVKAIADRIIENLGKEKIKPIGIEGYEIGHWILLDFGAVVAHIFYTETREFYALEKLWSDAPKEK